jgi:hypothetical protein
VSTARQSGQVSAEPPRTSLPSWRPIRAGALISCALVSLQRGLQMHHTPFLLDHGRAWATLAAKPIIASDVAHVHGIGETRCVGFLRGRDRAQSVEFSTPIVDPVLGCATDPEVFG